MNEKIKQKYLSIIKKYEEKLIIFNEKLKNTQYKCVFNNQLIDNNLLNGEIKAIIIMDNPGLDELKNNQYLIGKAGKSFNKLIQSLSTPQYPISRNNLLVFNKSSLFSKSTSDLVKIYENNNIYKIFLEEQKYTFKTIFKIHKLLKIPLMIHGYTNYFKNKKKFIENNKSNRPLYIFFQLLFKNYEKSEIKDLVYFFHHSSYGSLEKQLREYLNNLKEKGENYERNFENYKKLGKFNLEGFWI